MTEALDSIHHLAIPVKHIDDAVNWYRSNFRCEVSYQDETWAFLRFENLHLALVIPEQHPPHLALSHPHAESYGELTTHRDGTRSCYVSDPAGNAVEILDADSLSR